MAGIKYKDSNGDYQLLLSMNGLSTHVHGNMSNDGKVGTESGKFLQTGANGLVVADALKVGTVAGQTLRTGTGGLVVAGCPHDIGDIVHTKNATSPATRWPGTTWAALGGRMLIGVDGTYTIGATGGAATHANSLSDSGYAKAGSIAAPYLHYKRVGTSTWQQNWYSEGTNAGTGGGDVSIGIGLGGVTDAANNMPPYLVVYMWERTA